MPIKKNIKSKKTSRNNTPKSSKQKKRETTSKTSKPSSPLEAGLLLLCGKISTKTTGSFLIETLEKEIPETLFLICFSNHQPSDIAASSLLPKAFLKEVTKLKVNALQKAFSNGIKFSNSISTIEINSHPGWKKLSSTLTPQGLKICRTFPVLDSKEKFSGVIGMLTSSRRPPTKAQLNVLENAARIVQITNERLKEKERVKKLKARLANEAEERTQKMREAIRQLQDEIVQRKMMERSLKTSNEKLQNLSNHLENVREEERTRISREIHDELGQMLTTLKMKLAILEERTLDEGFPIQEDIQAMMGLVETTLQTVRRISTELRPGILDVLGLSEAVEWQSQEFHEQTKIEIETRIQRLPENIGKDLSTACFRICQEALTNVARHAEANRVTVSLRHTNGKVELFVRDNGKGITNEQLSHITSLGLIGMRERAQNLGGDLNIERTTPNGTQVSISFPLEIAK